METEVVSQPTGLARASDQQKAVYTLLQKAKPQLEEAAAGILDIDRVLIIAMEAWGRTPLLQLCTPVSILKAVRQSCALGLEPGSQLGLYYLVPFKNKSLRPPINYEATGIVGYRGYVQLAYRSGHVGSIMARCIYANDDFSIDLDSSSIQHTPHWLRSPAIKEPGGLVGVYGIAHLVNGGKVADAMSKDQVDKIRSRSRASDSGPWVTDYDEMARKTMVRRMQKYLPLTKEQRFAEEVDTHADKGTGAMADVIDVEGNLVAPEEVQGRVDTIKQALREKKDADSASAAAASIQAHVKETGEILPDFSMEEGS